MTVRDRKAEGDLADLVEVPTLFPLIVAVHTLDQVCLFRDPVAGVNAQHAYLTARIARREKDPEVIGQTAFFHARGGDADRPVP